MDYPTIIAAVTFAVWLTRDRETQALRHRVQDVVRTCSAFAYRRAYAFYVRHRSEISLLMGYVFRYPDPFDCDCCCLRLGRQDLDVDYHQACDCDATGALQYCYHCICTYVETQVTDNQSTQPVCMTTRQCKLDDRLVRKRLSSAAVLLLDRNQVVESARARGLGKETSEKLWHCPLPDCSYMGFISSTTSRDPERLSIPRSLWRLLTSSKKESPDHRCVRCPKCMISSCQFCSHVWSRGAADHTGLTCQVYASQLATASRDGAASLERWKSRVGVQQCRLCHATIEKNDGCKHMTCRCGYEFCWVCRQEWTPQHLFSRCRPPPAPAQTNESNVAEDRLQRFVTWAASWFHI
jgi:IBR domain, a half RING-finger domain